MGISVSTSKQSVTATVNDQTVKASVAGGNTSSATVTAGFGATGAQGPSGVVNVTAPITNTGTASAADIGISLGEGLSVSSGSLRVTPGTYATLVGGTVPSAQLPSYVDDVLEFANVASLPVTGESGKIYVALNTGRIYRWSGSAYFEISTPPANTDAVPEGSSNLYFTNARARNSFGTGTTGQVVAWSGSEWTAGTVAIASVTGLQTALDGKAASSHNHDASAINAGTLGADRLPLASANTRGAVRIGNGVSIDGNGVISVSGGGDLPPGDEGQVLTYVDGEWVAANSTGGNPFDQELNTTDSPTFESLGLPSGGSVDLNTNGMAIAVSSADAVVTLGTYDGETLLDMLLLGIRSDKNATFIQSLNDTLRVEATNGVLGTITINAIKFSDDSQQTTAWTGGVDAANVTGLATVATSGSYDDLLDLPSFDGSYTSLTSVPSTFTPSAHNQAWSTITSTPTSLSGYGITDAASATHTHAASDINSGTLSIDRIPTGTTSTTVSLGDHTHAQLHDRSHAITSTSDHTATAWRAFYSNGSGQIVELALGAQGTVLTSGGASAAPTFETPASTTPTVASPSQITANQNDYAGATADINRLDADAARDITGLSGGSSGLTRVLINVGSNAITLKHQSTSSTAANRIIVPWASDYILDPSYAAVLVYDATTSRWRII
jgi:hypothetical protein